MYQKTPTQIALRWILQHGCLPLPGTSQENHMKENLAITDFSLSSEVMEAIDKKALKGERERVKIEDGLGFADEFDNLPHECWPNTGGKK